VRPLARPTAQLDLRRDSPARPRNSAVGRLALRCGWGESLFSCQETQERGALQFRTSRTRAPAQFRTSRTRAPAQFRNLGIGLPAQFRTRRNSGPCAIQDPAQFRNLSGKSDGCRVLRSLLSLQSHHFLNNELASGGSTPELRAGRAQTPELRRGAAGEDPELRRGAAGEDPELRRGAAGEDPELRRGAAGVDRWWG
jgi:hypothetical protein